MSGFAGLAGHLRGGGPRDFRGLRRRASVRRIGKLSMIGGCSKIVQDVPPFMIAGGNPGETRTIKRSASNAMAFPTRRRPGSRRYKIIFRDKHHHHRPIRSDEVRGCCNDDSRELAASRRRIYLQMRVAGADHVPEHLGRQRISIAALVMVRLSRKMIL